MRSARTGLVSPCAQAPQQSPQACLGIPENIHHLPGNRPREPPRFYRQALGRKCLPVKTPVFSPPRPEERRRQVLVVPAPALVPSLAKLRWREEMRSIPVQVDDISKRDRVVLGKTG